MAEELKEILASEILDKIEKGEPVEYDHVRIIGNLDLSKLEVVSSRVKITHSTFDSDVLFVNTFFKNKIDFKGTTFKQDAYFIQATFGDIVNFQVVTFKQNAYFIPCVFG